MTESVPLGLARQGDDWRRIEIRGGDPIGSGASFRPRKRVGVGFRIGTCSGRIFTVVSGAEILPDVFLRNRDNYRVRREI